MFSYQDHSTFVLADIAVRNVLLLTQYNWYLAHAMYLAVYNRIGIESYAPHAPLMS